MKEEDKIKYYNEEFYEKRSERDKRIQELVERENIIRKEKNKLITERPWFRKPQNLIAIFGILFPIIASFLISIYQKDKKELTVYTNKIERLITDSEHIKTNVFIKHDSSEINNISKLSFIIKNTGTEELSKSDFSDGPIQLFIARRDSDKPVQILDIVNRENADQQLSELNLVQKEGRVSYLPSLMNVNDKVAIDVYILNTPKVDIEVIGKISNGEILGPLSSQTEDVNYGYTTFVLSIISIFKFKWVAVFTLIILFILTALSSLFQFVMIKDNELDPKILGILMALSTTFLSILSIILIVSILIL